MTIKNQRRMFFAMVVIWSIMEDRTSSPLGSFIADTAVIAFAYLWGAAENETSRMLRANPKDTNQ